MQRRINSKWKKMRALQHNAAVARNIPKTREMSRSSLSAMLQRFGMVYIKPDEGTFGDGVGRIVKHAKHYEYRVGVHTWTFKSYPALYRHIKTRIGNKPYLVQQGIQLLKHRGRRFDIRVMVQENAKKRMEATGIIGRVAPPKKIITNYHGGGQLKSVDTLLTPYLPKPKRTKYIKRLKRLGWRVGRTLRTQYPGIKETGVDVAVDQRLFPWILEVNTRPDPSIFKHLKNKSIYRKVVRYARAYGRYKLKPMKHTRNK